MRLHSRGRSHSKWRGYLDRGDHGWRGLPISQPTAKPVSTPTLLSAASQRLPTRCRSCSEKSTPSKPYLDGHRDFERTFIVWNAAFLSLAVVGFLTKSTEIASRGMLVLFYAGGLTALTATASVTRGVLRSLIAAQRLAARAA